MCFPRLKYWEILTTKSTRQGTAHLNQVGYY